jgi:hypothetical protein
VGQIKDTDIINFITGWEGDRTTTAPGRVPAPCSKGFAPAHYKERLEVQAFAARNDEGSSSAAARTWSVEQEKAKRM